MNQPKRITGQGPPAIAICEALGLDPKSITGIVFSMRVGEIVTVTVYKHVYDNEAKGLAKVLQRFNLVPEVGEEDVTSLEDTSRKFQIHKDPA